MSQDTHGPGSRPRKPMFDQDASARQRPGTGGGVPPAPPARDELADGPNMINRARGRKKQRQGEDTKLSSVHMSQRNAARKRKKKQRRRIILISLSLVVLLLAGSVLWVYFTIDREIQGADTPAGIVPQEVKTETIPEYTGKGIITALICGIDYNNDAADGYIDPTNKIGNTDMIMYMMYDTVKGKVNILQVPRDTFVGEEVETGGIGKINALYPNAEDENNRVAPLARVFYNQFKLPVDFYLTIDMDALKALVAHLGYIEVYVPHDIIYKDPETGAEHLEIEAGWRNITENEIESLVRNRNYPDGDISRIRTQMSLYSALFREMGRLAPMDLVMWMRILVYYVKVDGVSTLQLGGLAQKALNITGADVSFVRPPYWGSSYKPKKGALEGYPLDVVCLNPEGTAEVLNEYFRPDGSSYTAEQLGIQTLPVNQYGEPPAEVRTMGDIQAAEPQKP